jgi:hypothetical protein
MTPTVSLGHGDGNGDSTGKMPMGLMGKMPMLLNGDGACFNPSTPLGACGKLKHGTQRNKRFLFMADERP